MIADISRRPMRSVTAAMLLGVVLSSGCRHRATPAPAPAPAKWEYCWWTVLVTTLPLDSVATRFERAFLATGHTGVNRMRIADTAWTLAGLAPIDSVTRATYSARAVAFRQGDTTRFRYYVAVSPPTDSAANRIALCGTIARAAAIPTMTYRRDPNADDSLAVWNRVP